MRKRVDDNVYGIGSNIRIARLRAALTQEEMAEKIGVTPQYLSDLERGLVGTSLSTLIRICTNLNVSADYILFGKSETDAVNSALIERIQKLPGQKAAIVKTSLDAILDALEMDAKQQNTE